MKRQKVILKCMPCGASREVTMPEHYTDDDLLRKAQHAIGWVAYYNNVGPGIVTFCSHECCTTALTKSGFFRRDFGKGRMKRQGTSV